jgi:hypothetical protein
MSEIIEAVRGKLSAINHKFKKPPIIIGGMAMEYYEMRKSGEDIDLVVLCSKNNGKLHTKILTVQKLAICPEILPSSRLIQAFYRDTLRMLTGWLSVGATQTTKRIFPLMPILTRVFTSRQKSEKKLWCVLKLPRNTAGMALQLLFYNKS